MSYTIELTVGVEEVLPPDFEHTVVCKSVYKDTETDTYFCEIKGIDDLNWQVLKESDSFLLFNTEIHISSIKPSKPGKAASILITF